MYSFSRAPGDFFSYRVNEYSVDSLQLRRVFYLPDSDSLQIIGHTFPRVVAMDPIDRYLWIYNIEEGEIVSKLEPNDILQDAPWYGMSQDRIMLFSDTRYVCWDCNTGKIAYSGYWKHSPEGNVSANLSGTCISAYSDGTLYLYDFNTGELLQEIKENLNEGHSFYLSDDGRLLLTLNQQGLLRLRECESGKIIEEFKSPAFGPETDVYLSPDGESIIVSTPSLSVISVKEKKITMTYPVYGESYVYGCWVRFVEGGKALILFDDEEQRITRIPYPSFQGFGKAW